MGADQSSLFGGNVVPSSTVIERIKKDAANRAGMQDVPLIFKIPEHHTSYKNALVFEQGATISDDFVVNTDEKWLKKNQIAFIVSFGDLSIQEDLINSDEHYWPVIYVSGDLSVCNILKGAAPLVVTGNLNATGYILGEFNDGPMHIGGDLNALGYIPLARDMKGLPAHKITGRVNARLFDGRLDFTRNDLIRAVKDENVLIYKWFNIASLFQKGREGISVWRDPCEHFEEKVATPPPPPAEFSPIDAVGFGSVEKTNGYLEILTELIAQKIAYEPERYSYPESFASYVRIHLNDNAQDNVLILPPGTVIDGDLQLDWEAPWVMKHKIAAIVCLGDLEIKGTVRNRTLEGGPMLFVGGKLRVDNLIKSGATVIVLDDVIADGLVIGEYNDGVTRFGGNLTAKYFILLDHDGFVRGEVIGKRLSDDDEEFRDIMIDSVFLDEDETMPDVDLLWAHHQAKREFILSK